MKQAIAPDFSPLMQLINLFGGSKKKTKGPDFDFTELTVQQLRDIGLDEVDLEQAKVLKSPLIR